MQDKTNSIDKSDHMNKSDDDSVEKLRSEVKDLKEKLEKTQEEQKITLAIQNNLKSERTTLALSIILGLFGLSGIGHIYVNKTGKGIVILVASVIAVWIFGIPLTIQDSNTWFSPIPRTSYFGIMLLIGYVNVYLWQIIDSRRSCQRYNLEIYKSHSTKYV